ncbi:MAG: hypothetical protein JWL95_351 [Gemmatimonadetes bacterium]|nr:hypothetical protein [Gemmatimonadota bacterium]
MLDQQEDTGHAPADGRLRTALYRRPMPGGGYVDVEMDAVRGSTEVVARAWGKVILERRADHRRRTGHRPPVVAEMAGDDADELMAELFRLARDNAALARSLMRWQSARDRAD